MNPGRIRFVNRNELAQYLDHTLLKPEATPEQIRDLCREATLYEVAAVCVSPWQLPIPDGLLPDSIAIATVVGFPSGAVATQVKALEAAFAVGAGAREIDMVVNLGMVKAAEWELVEDDISQVRMAVPKALLKVILETATLTGDEIDACCEAAELAGADFVKTSTGFHPAGGATVEAVRRMAACVGGRLGIKASGGIRDTATALAMIESGATRLGTSATLAILDGLS
jgi:deoxyribose-phosphate aldolase